MPDKDKEMIELICSRCRYKFLIKKAFVIFPDDKIDCPRCGHMIYKRKARKPYQRRTRHNNNMNLFK